MDSQFISRLLQTAQLASLIKNLQFAEADRERRARLDEEDRKDRAADRAYRDKVFGQRQTEFEAGQADRSYKRKVGEADAMGKLIESGARQMAATDVQGEDLLTSLFGTPSRARVEYPFGSFALPTHEESLKRDLDDILRTGRVKTALEIENQDKLSPGRLREHQQKTDIDTDAAIDRATALSPVKISEAEARERARAFYRPEKTAKAKSPFTAISNFEKEKRKAESLYNKAKLFEAAGQPDEAAAARGEADSQLKHARAIAEQIKGEFGDQVEVGESDGWPYIKQTAASTGTSGYSVSLAKPTSFPASKLSALARKRGKSVKEVRKELTAQGIAIEETE